MGRLSVEDTIASIESAGFTPRSVPCWTDTCRGTVLRRLSTRGYCASCLDVLEHAARPRKFHASPAYSNTSVGAGAIPGRRLI